MCSRSIHSSQCRRSSAKFSSTRCIAVSFHRDFTWLSNLIFFICVSWPLSCYLHFVKRGKKIRMIEVETGCKLHIQSIAEGANDVHISIEGPHKVWFLCSSIDYVYYINSQWHSLFLEKTAGASALGGSRTKLSNVRIEKWSTFDPPCFPTKTQLWEHAAACVRAVRFAELTAGDQNHRFSMRPQWAPLTPWLLDLKLVQAENRRRLHRLWWELVHL